MVGLKVDILENDNPAPVITHIFWGKDLDEAVTLSDVHRRTDEFYNAAVALGHWRGITLRIEMEIVQR